MHAPVTLYLYMTHTPWHPLSFCTRSPSSSYSNPLVSFHPSQLHCTCPSSTAPLTSPASFSISATSPDGPAAFPLFIFPMAAPTSSFENSSLSPLTAFTVPKLL